MAIKKFKFRLEKVLQFREGVKEEKKRALLLRNQELNEEIARLEELEAAWSRNGIREDGVMELSEILMAGIFTARLKEDIAQQRVRIEQSKKRVEEAMAEYIEAARDARSLVMLKERKAEEYKKYLEREELKVLDELTVQKGNTLHDETSAENPSNNMEQ
jgi:flagellar FliJ protein